jgi:hypothetical protein
MFVLAAAAAVVGSSIIQHHRKSPPPRCIWHTFHPHTIYIMQKYFGQQVPDSAGWIFPSMKMDRTILYVHIILLFSFFLFLLHFPLLNFPTSDT